MLNHLLETQNLWHWMAIDVTAKATVLLLVAAGLALSLGRSSSALRHRLWALLFVALLLLPLANIALPGLSLRIIPRDLPMALVSAEKTGVPATQPAEPMAGPEPAGSPQLTEPDGLTREPSTARLDAEPMLPDGAEFRGRPAASNSEPILAAPGAISLAPWQYLTLFWLTGTVSVLIPLA